MAPLIDCVFLLLIFFLVATTLKKIDKELPLELPRAEATLDVQQPKEHTILAIDAEGVFYIDGTPVPTSMINNKIEELGNTDAEHKIRLDIDRNAPFKHVMPIRDQLRFAGLSNTGINTKKEEDGAHYR